MPNEPLTELEKINPLDYDMSFNEKIAGAALKQYFLVETEKSKKALGEVMKKQTFFLNPASPDKPILLAADIDGKKLAELIDTAAHFSAELCVRNGMEAEDSTFHMTAAMFSVKMEISSGLQPRRKSAGMSDVSVKTFRLSIRRSFAETPRAFAIERTVSKVAHFPRFQFGLNRHDLWIPFQQEHPVIIFDVSGSS